MTPKGDESEGQEGTGGDRSRRRDDGEGGGERERRRGREKSGAGWEGGERWRKKAERSSGWPGRPRESEVCRVQVLREKGQMRDRMLEGREKFRPTLEIFWVWFQITTVKPVK